MTLESKTMTLSDGRKLGYAEFGHPGGKPVIGFHGMPGSRLMMKAFEPAACALGVRLIAPDRPGYGLSDPHPRGTLLTYPKDVLEMAGGLGLNRFAVAGVSGGGPYALACAHELPGRLTAAGVISGIGPLRLPNSTRDMLRMNRIMFTLGRFSPAFAGLLLSRLIKSSLPSMEKHIQDGTSPTQDLSPEVFAIMAADQREAIRSGGQGLIFDMKMLWRPWGFKPEDIRARVWLWHGESDTLAPVMLAHVLAQQIPGCRATFYPGEGHTDPLTQHGEEILAKLVDAAESN